MSLHRVAIGGILTECNQLGGPLIDKGWFERYELCRGDAILGTDSGVVGGMLGVLAERGAEPVPLLYASTCPGGLIEADCYAELRGELIDALRACAPVDGVLLPLHGAAVAEDVEDVEGDLITAVRGIVGPTVPIVGTLDLHAHVTAAMVQGADALLAWETYPHRDAFETGERGARMLLDTLEGRCRPTMAVGKVPVITGGIHGSTEGDGPFAQVMRFAKSLEGRGGVLSTSVFLVHPVLDQPDLGSGGIVVTDNDPSKAATSARQIAEAYWARRFDLEPEVHTPADAIARGLGVDGGPVLLVETADCCGGGAAGDSVATLRALLEAKVDDLALVPVVDPEGAAACHRAGVNGEVTLSIGHKLDPQWGEPITVTGRVIRVADGRFRYSGGIWDGVEGDMGPSAVLTVGEIRVLIASHGTYDWADEQFRSMGLDPSRAKFVVAKNPMNYRLAYGAIAKAAYILDTPGPTPATVRNVSYRSLERPYFPLDEQIPGMSPVVLR
ncbi:MAG: M81 family metallopeptidase [Candidatus Latescibacteria bacterium]|jgi:microcystin degradation protein MlrC|nr:M81 family metallopeptidase [Candidatus Latescibacterota bacterium]